MSVESLAKCLNQKPKPDVIFLADFPKEPCHPQTNLHYITRIYAQQNRDNNIEQEILSLETEGQIKDPLDTTSGSTQWNIEQFDRDMKQMRERDNFLQKKVLHACEPTSGMSLFYNQDAFVIQHLLGRGHSIAFDYLEKEDPLEATPINKYTEIGALVQKVDEDGEDRTEFVRASKYNDVLPYRDYTTKWNNQYTKRCSEGPSLSELIGKQKPNLRQTLGMLRLVWRMWR